jgi:hypothetical protein
MGLCAVECYQLQLLLPFAFSTSFHVFKKKRAVLLVIISDTHSYEACQPFYLPFNRHWSMKTKEIRFHCVQVTLPLSDCVKLFSCVSNSYTGWTRIIVGSPYTVVVNTECVT